jgi:glycerol-3-phosphate dehydrogenase (NAD(P)+)
MKVSVVGSGAWGTALAIRLHKNGHDVTMWTFEKDLIEEMEQTRRNPRLPNAELPEGLKISGDYACVRGSKLVVIASPSFPMRSVCRGVAPYIDEDAVVVSVTKGIEDGTCKRMSQIVADETGKKVVVLCGPSHAEEVALDMPTGCLAACEDQALAEFVQDAFMSEYFRIYTSSDPVGAELGAALKNVIALCAGVCDGLGAGDNTKAMLMTRGLTEIARLAVAIGGNKDTIAGLAGVGDLIVTCTSKHSRNYRAGVLVGQGKTPAVAMDIVGAVVEGYYAARSAFELAQKLQVEMPILQSAYRVLYEEDSAADMLKNLLLRQCRPESEDIGWL